MYEMLVGYPPFYSDDPMTTCRKVQILFLRYFVKALCNVCLIFFLHCDFCNILVKLHFNTLKSASDVEVSLKFSASFAFGFL